MSSNPLLTSVEELIVTTGPICHVGWARACSARTPRSWARLRPRKGPPDAVRTICATSERPDKRGEVSPFSWTPDANACAMAECSESTGTIWPGKRIASRTSAPPTTRDSLFASARRAPHCRAASVADSPTPPVIPLRTTRRGRPGSVPTSSALARTSSTDACAPTNTSGHRAPSSRTAASSWLRTSRATATNDGFNATICAASSPSVDPPALKPTTSKRPR